MPGVLTAIHKIEHVSYIPVHNLSYQTENLLGKIIK